MIPAMDLDTGTKLALAALTVVGAVLEVSRRVGGGGRRGRVLRDLEIWKALPDNSDAKGELLGSIESDVREIVETSQTKRRDPAGMTLALIFIAAGILVGYYGVTNDGWWRALLVLSAVLLLFGTVGFSEDVRPAVRDEKGRRLDRD